VNTPEVGNDFLVSVCACVFICGALYPEREGKIDSCLLLREGLNSKLMLNKK